MARSAARKDTRSKMAKQTITYTTAKFHRRCFANLIDFLLFALVFLGFFLATRAIVISTPAYQEKENTLLAIRIDSGLYVKTTEGKVEDLVVHYENGTFSSYTKVVEMDSHLEQFIVYLDENVSAEASDKVRKDYDSFRLGFKFTKNGENIPYFITDEGGDIVRNVDELITPGKVSMQNYFDQVYAPFYDEHALGYLVTLVPQYLDLVHYESAILFGLEIPVGWVLAGVLVYLVPGFFFRRGRMTFGKWVYHIGLADKNLLSPKLGIYIARWAIYFVLILTASIFTFGIPVIISFSLMAFSSRRQGLPDYMLNLVEVDTSNSKLYFSFEEITLSGAAESKAPIDFKPIDKI